MPEPVEWHSLVAPIVFLVALLVMFWLIVIRPTNVRQRKHKELIESIVPGDKVLTVGGIYGKITTVGEKSLGLEIAKGITIRIDRRAVRRRQDEEDF